MPKQYLYLALSVLAMGLFEAIRVLTGEPNLPPQVTQTRFWINLIMLNAWGAYLWILYRRPRLRVTRKTWIMFFAVGVVLCAVLPIFSGDHYEYQIRGRILGVYHDNPYAHTSSEYPQDMFYPLSIWRNTPDNYGPAWGMIQWIAPSIMDASVRTAVFGMKFMLLLFFAASGWLIRRIAGETHPESVDWVTLAFCLNPNLISQNLIDGHNDIVMVFWMLLSWYWMIRKRPYLALAAGTMAALVKYTAALCLPVLGIAALRKVFEGDRTRSARFILLAPAVCAAVSAAVYAPFWIGADTFKYFAVFKDWFYSNSVPYAAHGALSALGWSIDPESVKRAFMLFFAVQWTLALLWLMTRKILTYRNIFLCLFWMYTALHLSYAIPFYGSHLTWDTAFLILSGLPYPVLAVGLFTGAGIFAYFKRLSFLYVAGIGVYAVRWVYGRRRR